MPGTRIRKKKIINQMKTEFSALSVNEGLARSMVCAMTAQLDVSVDALADVRCAVSEAVTNAIVHGYGAAVRASGADTGSTSPHAGTAGTGGTGNTGGTKGTAGGKTVYILTTLYSDNSVKIIIRDRGRGIADVKRAMEPLYTTDTTGERSGMGFAIMQSFMDAVRVRSVPGKGTTVELRKRFSAPAEGSGAEGSAAEKDSVPSAGRRKRKKPSGASPAAQDKPETAVEDTAPENAPGTVPDDPASEEA